MNIDNALPRRGSIVVWALAALVVGVVGFGVSAALGAGGSKVVKVSRNAKLGERILVTRSGRTLYHLSVEKRGHFICKTQSCLALWHPLVVARGVKPTGAQRLGTVKRPDGRMQVTYRGGPLYTFVPDSKPGEVKGNGFKDVGVWRPVAVGRSRPVTTTTPTTTYPYP